MAIVKRLDKGSELTHAELDGNFTDLDTRVSVIEGSSGSGLSNVVEDTTPQLGGVLDTNGNNITFSGSDKAQFGTSQDLSIFHNNNHSIIRETGTGSLYLQSDNNVILSTDSGTKKMIKGVGSGAVELYHNDVLKLNTSTSGVTVVDEVHTEGATPHLTLKRTDNANVPTVRFKGSGGTIGASIDYDGTSGDSNTLFIQTFDGASLAERFRVGHTGVTIAGTLNGHTIPAGAGTLALLSDIGGGGAITIQDEGSALSTAATTLNFVGAGVTASGTGGVKTITIAGGGGGGGATNMAGLTDVDSVDTVASGDFLLYDGSSSEYKFVAFEAEVNGLIDNRTGSSGHISTQSQYAGSITTDAADPTDTAHHILGNTGSASIHTASTGWYYGDVVSDPANPTTSVVLDIDQQRFTGAIQSDSITVGSGGGITAQAGATIDFQGTTVHFGSATIAGGSAFKDTIDNHIWAGATAPTNGYVLSWNTSLLAGAGDYEWVVQSGGGGGLADVVDDTTPQLGGDLDTNGNKITNSTGVILQYSTTDRITTTSTGARVDGVLELAEGVNEQLSILTGATGTVDHDCSNGYIFRHTTPAADFTANLTNFYCNNNCVTSVSMMIIQGATAYIPNALQISGTPQTISWQGGSVPAGNANKTDVFTFTITNLGTSYEVIAQLVDFG